MRSTTTRMAAVPMAVVMAMAFAMASVGVVIAQASPGPGPSAEASCAYTLTAPFVVTVSGTNMVTATLAHGPCAGAISPNSMTVCVELKGYTPPQCAFHSAFDPIQVYFAPYRRGATYVATGRGCGNVFPFGDESCSSLGPYTTTL